MCGISGVITKSTDSAEDFLRLAEKAQIHRGPDSQDSVILQKNNWNIGLGHQRLSILDLSSAGCQPMTSASKKSLITYNGEIYNYLELKNEYLSSETRSSSDTEVILELIEKHGIQRALNLFNGMWAFAWFDLAKKKTFHS
jgi:asparagine synthase (glutamine-hydrolysing)